MRLRVQVDWRKAGGTCTVELLILSFVSCLSPSVGKLGQADEYTACWSSIAEDAQQADTRRRNYLLHPRSLCLDESSYGACHPCGLMQAIAALGGIGGVAPVVLLASPFGRPSPLGHN